MKHRNTKLRKQNSQAKTGVRKVRNWLIWKGTQPKLKSKHEKEKAVYAGSLYLEKPELWKRMADIMNGDVGLY